MYAVQSQTSPIRNVSEFVAVGRVLNYKTLYHPITFYINPNLQFLTDKYYVHTVHIE